MTANVEKLYIDLIENIENNKKQFVFGDDIETEFCSCFWHYKEEDWHYKEEEMSDYLMSNLPIEKPVRP